MGVPVIVDSEDLEALLFACAAVKKIELAFEQSRDDPFLGRVKGKYTAAHDTVAKAWRSAATEVKADIAGLSQQEINALIKINTASVVMQEDVPADDLRSLRMRMLVEVGNLYEISCAMWGNTQEETRKIKAEQLVVRLTPEGHEAVKSFIVRPVAPTRDIEMIVHDLFYDGDSIVTRTALEDSPRRALKR